MQSSAAGLAAEACSIWWLPLTSATPELPARVSPAERARADRYRRPEDRDRSLLSAALLRAAAASVTGVAAADVAVSRACPDCSEEHGRPMLPGSGLHVSASHSGGWVCVALTRSAPIGVDVEQVGRRIVGIAGSIGPPADPTGGDGARALTVLWTRKEAVLKADGSGLRTPMPEVVVTAAGVDPALVRHPTLRPDAVFLADLMPDGEHVGAVAVLTGGPLTVVERPGAALFGSMERSMTGEEPRRG
jgi:4'-phosphopantetheinyl transferase